MSLSYEERLSKLNTAQRLAVDTIEGPVMVIAGPGSGKTELLSLRVATILKNTDTLPNAILCLTFTDSGSVNMRKRLAGLIGNAAYHVAIHTFHSFGTEILGQFREFFYGGADMEAADEITKMEILKGIFETLPHDSPFHTKLPDQGYLYLKDVAKKISDLKQGGLTPKNFREILEQNRNFLEMASSILLPFFSERASKGMLQNIPTIVAKIAAIPDVDQDSAQFFSLKTTYLESFRAILAGQDTKLITAWKDTYLKSDKEGGGKVLKDMDLLEKNFALAEAYSRYGEEMIRQGYFDFDDMLLQVVHALETNPEIKATLQEKYLYLMVDEFQDTNGVQMKLLDLLTGVGNTQARPNILVVGDDDQAVFKFQGANLHNILGFHKKYEGAKLVTLTENYRSTQEVLDLARKVIIQGEERLENHMFDLQKDLLAANTSLEKGEILEKEFQIALEEHIWIAEDIKKRIKEGTPAGEIAVIARKHDPLREIIKLLELYGIPVAYEQRQNILEEPHVDQLLCMLEYVDSIVKHELAGKDYLLPKILSFPFWNISPDLVWAMSLTAHKERKSWGMVMKHHPEKSIQNIYHFFADLALKANTHTAEEIIDLLLGVTKSLIDDEGVPIEEGEEPIKVEYTSPYKEYYFSKILQKQHPEQYIRFLSNLQILIQKVRNYKKKKTYIAVSDMVTFIELHREYDLKIIDNNPIHKSQDAVQLLTSHKAKGMEFETVYLIHVQEDSWIEGQMPSKISFPSNVPLAAEGDTTDDKLRLFFVALTRAKRNLVLTRHQYLENGKETVRLRFLNEEMVEKEKRHYAPKEMVEALKQNTIAKADLKVIDTLQTWFSIQAPTKFSKGQELLLRGALENYQMSVTHLNSFLDLTHAGPEVFLEQNILRFPQSKHPSSSYGTAMHSAVQKFYNEYKKLGERPTVEVLVEYFRESLSLERMNTLDFERYQEKGVENLTIYYAERKDFFSPTHIIEKDFRTLGVHVGDALLTGKLDRLVIDERSKEVRVTDFKTGKPFSSWKAGSYDQVKLWKYRQQLLFYKLLVEKSSTYAYGYKAVEGSLEFLEPDSKNKIQVLSLSYNACTEELQRLEKLIEVVYMKIMNLDFPDVSGYSKDMKGIERFVGDLLGE